MRSLPLQCGTIRIASVAGEGRRIRVSGLAKARLLWLFRNFYILDFPVLNQKQQQLISQVWNAGPIAASDDASADLIGTIEGFSPQLSSPPVPAREFRVGDRISIVFSPQPSVPIWRSWRLRVRLRLPGGLRVVCIPALSAVMGILLLGGVIALGPQLLPSMPPSRVAAAIPANPVRATATATAALPAPTSAEPAPSVASSPAPATDASSSPPLWLPDAMAQDESSPKLNPPHPRLALGARPLAKPEVVLSVSVDSEGHAQAFQFLHGDQKKTSAALNAARQLSFQPCSSSAECDHLLKFTDYGDAFIMQRID